MHRAPRQTRYMVCVGLLLVVALVGLTYLVPASAQAPAGVTVFEGARLIVGDGRAPIENATFVVTAVVSPRSAERAT